MSFYKTSVSGPPGPPGPPGPMGPMAKFDKTYFDEIMKPISEMTKKYNEKIEQLEHEIENLKLQIIELQLRPPNEGGKLYEASKTHFESLDSNDEQNFE